jgi:thiamine biosynthesis lipoprotein
MTGHAGADGVLEASVKSETGGVPEAGGVPGAGNEAADGGQVGQPTVKRTVEVMGTVVSFTVLGLGAAAAETALDQASDVLREADETFSLWKPGSPVSRLRRGETELAQVPPEISDVLELCRTARTWSRGWFDPWAMPGGVDPTGLVKGWAVERARDVLHRAGAAAALVSGGGDLAVFGQPAPGREWRVGIQHPWRRDALAGIIEVRAAAATSGSYERGPHLIDPRTGRPGHRGVSATVTGPSLALADALATAVTVGGDDALEAVGELDGYAGYLIRPDGSEAYTDGIVVLPR